MKCLHSPAHFPIWSDQTNIFGHPPNSVTRRELKFSPGRKRLPGQDSAGRSGVIFIAVIAVMLLTSAISIELIQTVLQMRQTAEQRDLVVQTELLAQAGLDRAAFQFRKNPERQELSPWTPVLPEGKGTAQVTYQWERIDDSPRLKIKVVAEFTNVAGQSARHELAAEIDTPSN